MQAFILSVRTMLLNKGEKCGERWLPRKLNMHWDTQMIVRIAQRGREACRNLSALVHLFPAAQASPKLQSNNDQKGEDYKLMTSKKTVTMRMTMMLSYNWSSASLTTPDEAHQQEPVEDLQSWSTSKCHAAISVELIVLWLALLHCSQQKPTAKVNCVDGRNRHVH